MATLTCSPLRGLTVDAWASSAVLLRARPAGAVVDEMVEKPPLGMWADGFGRLATRSLQALIVLGIATLLFIGLRSVTVVTIPVLLALIFASAFAPAMRWMRRRGVPSALAAVITLLTIVIILGGVGWLIVWAVRDQWDDLYAQGEEGFQTLLAWVQDLPFAPTDDQLEGARTRSSTSSRARSSAREPCRRVGGRQLPRRRRAAGDRAVLLPQGRPPHVGVPPATLRGRELRARQRIGERTVDVRLVPRGTALVALVDAVGIGIGLADPAGAPRAAPGGADLRAVVHPDRRSRAGGSHRRPGRPRRPWGRVQALIVVGVVVLVQQLESNILQPFLMGRTMRLNAFVVLIALAAGTVLGGILGAILAVPLTAAAWGVVQVWDGPDTPARWARRKCPEGEARDTLPTGSRSAR